jgi:large subunit ribosomal protein L22
MAAETKEYRAEAKFQRVSPQKARLVLNLIRGRGVQEAMEAAAFAKKRIAPVIYKLLASAVDNAKFVASEEGFDLDVDNLYVKRALANDGPRMKRIRPAPMGRAYRYQRRLAHIMVSIAERKAEEGLVTKVEEPAPLPASTKPSEAKPKAAKSTDEPETAEVQEETPKPAAKAAQPKAKKPKAAVEAKEEAEPAGKTAGAAKKKAGKKT